MHQSVFVRLCLGVARYVVYICMQEHACWGMCEVLCANWVRSCLLLHKHRGFEPGFVALQAVCLQQAGCDNLDMQRFMFPEHYTNLLLAAQKACSPGQGW